MRRCSCGHILHTRGVKTLGVQDMGKVKFILFNCPKCQSTGATKVEPKKEEQK